jgi:hypothetical protein
VDLFDLLIPFQEVMVGYTQAIYVGKAHEGTLPMSVNVHTPHSGACRPRETVAWKFIVSKWF